MREVQVHSLGQEDPLGGGNGTHSRILVWEIPWTKEPGGLQSTGSQRVGHDLASKLHQHVRDVIQYFSFSVSLASLRMTVSRSSHVAANGIISLFSMTECYSVVGMSRILLVQSSVGGHLGCLHLLSRLWWTVLP